MIKHIYESITQKWKVKAITAWDTETGPFNTRQQAINWLRSRYDFTSVVNSNWGGNAERYINHMVVPVEGWE